MSNFLKELASQSGLDTDQAHEGVGNLLAVLKDRLDPAAFAHVKNAIPNCDDLLSAIETKVKSAPAGVLGAVKDMAEKLIGSADEGTSTAVETDSESPGSTSEHLKSLLPKLHEMLAKKLPPDVVDQIRDHVPGFGPADE
jgi:uncharacterized protein (DUF2267 family)